MEAKAAPLATPFRVSVSTLFDSFRASCPLVILSGHSISVVTRPLFL